MDIEYHYYITYLIALACGFKIHEAYIIAYSSQMVDDNDIKYTIYDRYNKKILYKNLIPSITEKNINLYKLEKVLIPFHFLPDVKINNIRKDKIKHKFNTIKNSKLAQFILTNALKSKNLYWIGIATHAFVDTWAHQNFIGKNSNYNAFNNTLAKLLPNIAHLDALDKPDLVGLIWKDTRLKNEKINNVKRFLEASIMLTKLYLNFTQRYNPNMNKFLLTLKLVMSNNEKNNYIDVKIMKSTRIKKYNKLAKTISNFDILNYQKNYWRDEFSTKINNKNYSLKSNLYFKLTNWFKFQESIKLHYNFTLQALKSLHINL